MPTTQPDTSAQPRITSSFRRIRCPYCRGTHTHDRYGEPDGLRIAHCAPLGAIYAVTIDTWARIKAIREEYRADDGVVGMVPLHIGYCFEIDDNDDIIGIVLETAAGQDMHRIIFARAARLCIVRRAGAGSLARVSSKVAGALHIP